MEISGRIRTNFKWPTRTLAFVLVIALMSSIMLTLLTVASRVTIPQNEKTLNDAAGSYLASSTGYVGENSLQRMASYINTLGKQQTLQDFYVR